MSLHFTRHTSYRRLARIERHAMLAQQPLLTRAIAEFDRFFAARHSAPLPLVTSDCRSLGCVGALARLGDRYWGYDWEDFRELIMGGSFGVRLARIVRRAEELDAVLETVSEEYGTRDGASACACASWQDDRAARGDWEARHMERWIGD